MGLALAPLLLPSLWGDGWTCLKGGGLNGSLAKFGTHGPNVKTPLLKIIGFTIKFLLFSLNWPLGQFSLKANISVCVFVPLTRTRNRVGWGLLVKERIVKLAKPRTSFSWKVYKKRNGAALFVVFG